MTDVISTPFPDDLVGNDSVDNNLPHDELPIPVVPLSASLGTPESDDSNWSTPTRKEFRSSFLFQSSCYLPDDDGTESESSYTDHTVQVGPLHRHEQYPKQSPTFGLDAVVTSILKQSDSMQSIASVQRRVMFTDENKKIHATIGDDRPNLLSEKDVGEEKSSWMGYGVSVPLHQFHSLPLIPSLTATEVMNNNGEGIYCPPLRCGDEEDGYNTVSGAQSKTGVSTLTYNDSRNQNSDVIFSSILFPRAKRRQYVCFMIIFVIVVGCMTTAVTCGTLQCGGSSKSTATSSVLQENESLSPSMAPSTTQPPSILVTFTPSSVPTSSPKVIIRSTEELYDAVDAYISSRYNNSTDKSEGYLYYNQPIGQWDVSLVTNFTSVFDALRNPNTALFNDDISNWDTSNAVTMESMFYGAEKFNGNISTWKTLNVENMKEMFARATNFNENISLWDVSKVVTMEGMFRRAINFRGNLRQWNTSSVQIMTNMFLNCESFNGVGLDSWDTSNVIDMTSMFRFTPYFNGDVSSWNVSQVVKMRGMFRQAVAFNSDLSRWDVRRVTDMSQMFMHAVRFNADISGWTTTSLKYASEAFFGAISFNGDVSNWDVTNLIDLTKMFAGAINFKNDLCSWLRNLPVHDNILISTRSMFVATACPITSLPEFFGDSFCYACESQNITRNNVTNSSYFDTNENIFDDDRYKPILSQQELYMAVDEYLLNSTKHSKVALTYGYPIRAWNVSQVTNFSSVFDSDRNPLVRVFVDDLDGWDTSSALSMSRMFAGASWFNGNISTWSTGRVLTMDSMFHDAFSFNGDVSRWDTSSCTSMSSMFEGSDLFNGDLSQFDTSNVVNMDGMFRSAISFEGKGLENWNTSALTSMKAMFEETFSFTANALSSWDVSHVIDVSEAFQHSNFNGDISDWDVSTVELLNHAFSGAGAFNQDLSTWNISSAINFRGMFAGAKGFNQDLCDWAPLIKQKNVVYVSGMFKSSACLNERDPNIGENQPIESLCRDCNYS